MLDNGERSGGTRFNTEKPGFFWCVPMMGLRLIARVTMHGAKKYAPLDWAQGQSFSTLLDCMTRHLLEVLTRGVWARDIESGAYSMAHLGWNVLCILHFMEQKRTDLDDVTKWRGVTTAERNEKDMNVLHEGEVGEFTSTITHEKQPSGDDKMYVGPLQWAGKSAPTGLKGFVEEAKGILDKFDETTEARKERIRDREWGALVMGDWEEVKDWEGHPEGDELPTDAEMDEALRRKIIEQQMDDAEATANMGAEAALGRIEGDGHGSMKGW